MGQFFSWCDGLRLLEGHGHCNVDREVRATASRGLGEMYLGFGITALGSLPATCLYFTSYEARRPGGVRVVFCCLWCS